MSGISQVVCENMNFELDVTFIFPIMGGFIIIMNSCQLWYMRKQLSASAETFKTFLYSLSVSDLVMGIGVTMMYTCHATTKLLHSSCTTCANSGYLFENVLGRGSGSCSLLTMTAFTVVKMSHWKSNPKHTYVNFDANGSLV